MAWSEKKAMQDDLQELTENSSSLSPVDRVGLALDSRNRERQKLLHESPRRIGIDETMRVSFLGTFPEEDR